MAPPRQPSSVPPTSRQSWEGVQAGQAGMNEWCGDYPSFDQEEDVISTPTSLLALDMDQTIPSMVHKSSAWVEGSALLCEVCQASNCMEHTTGNDSVCPPCGQHHHWIVSYDPCLEEPQRELGVRQSHMNEALEVSHVVAVDEMDAPTGSSSQDQEYRRILNRGMYLAPGLNPSPTTCPPLTYAEATGTPTAL